jgi:hypothetical protein
MASDVKSLRRHRYMVNLRDHCSNYKERTMSDMPNVDKTKAAMRERNSMNLNNNGGKGEMACGKPQVKASNVTKTTNKPGHHPYDRK